MNVLSLFSGIGGIDLGLEAHGCSTVAYSEIDPYASKIMSKRFPDAVNLGDITTIDWSEAHERFGGFDIICGGFPCQDISLSGGGAGIAEGTRSGLWKYYAEAIRMLRPRGVLVENVAAILGRGLDRVLGDLASCGYDAEWDCIPAASVGAPHLRDRAFIMAYPDGASSEGGGVPGGVGSKNPNARCGDSPELRVWPPPLRDDAWDDSEGEGGSRPAPPGLHRMGHGVPNRVDRLRCLGNAVVPQVAEHVAGILMERLRETR